MDLAGGIGLAIFGVMLLLPGGCAIYFIATTNLSATNQREWGSVFALIWIVCLLISVGGVVLLLQALRRN